MEKKIVTNVEDMKKNNYFFYEDEGEDFIAICDEKTVNEAAKLWKMTPVAVEAIKEAFAYLAEDIADKLKQDLVDLYKRTE